MKKSLQFTASLLDRLIDVEPRAPHETPRQRLQGIGRIKTAVIRDLENLLNTRRNPTPLPVACREVGRSLFAYGTRDFSSDNPKNPSVRQKLRREMEKTIKRFEPRLRNVAVRVDTESKGRHQLRFRISAMLVIDPVSEPVAFDTYFDINRSEYRLSG